MKIQNKGGFAVWTAKLDHAQGIGGAVTISTIAKDVDLYLGFLQTACAAHPYLKAKIAVDGVDKGYLSFQKAAELMGLPISRWETFVENYKAGDLKRVPIALKNLVPSTEVRFLTGLTCQQLLILKQALTLPFLITENNNGISALLRELRVLAILGLLQPGRHHQFASFQIKVLW